VTEPGNLDDFTGRGLMFQVATGACPHLGETSLQSLVRDIKIEHGRVIIA
jgi:hypothetical protein